MSDLYEPVHSSIARACVAAFAVDPLNPSLSWEELRDLVIQDGHSGPLFDEAFPHSRHARQAGGGRVQVLTMDLIAMFGQRKVPREIPHAEALKLLSAFATLNRQLGAKSGKSVEMLAGSALSTREVERGLGFLLLAGHVQVARDGYVCDADSLQYTLFEKPLPVSPSPELSTAIERVRTIFASREGVAVASTPPIERFHLFLKKQGLEALAGWWSMTTQELRSLGDRHPTSATVLAASMLEAALVAIAEPAKNAGQWRNKDLLVSSERWKLGTLIDQAEAAFTLSKDDAVLARKLQDLRNRIHVGKFAVDGPERFKPQFANAHDATIALKHLEMLLDKILDWAPIAALG